MADKVIIGRAVLEAASRIQELAVSDPSRFTDILRQAFGQRINLNVERELLFQAAHRRLPLPNHILLVPAEVLKGAEGAYAAEDGGTIFINADFRRNSAPLPDLIIHEWGHHLDAVLGHIRASVEAGEIFLTGVKNSGPIPAAFERSFTALENDHGTIQFEGRTIPVEFKTGYRKRDRHGSGFFSWLGGAIKTAGQTIANVGKAVGNSVANRVKSIASGIKNSAVALGNTIKGMGQGVASGMALMTGNKALSDQLATDARGSFGNAGSSLKGVTNNAIDFTAEGGNLYNKTTVELNNAVPHLGTAMNIAVSLTPAAPYVAAAKGFADVKNAYENGGLNAALTAGAFAGLDVGGSALGRVGMGIKAAKAATAAERAAETAASLEKLSKGTKLEQALGATKGAVGKVDNLVDKVKASTVEANELTKATAGEIRLGTNLVNNSPKTTKFLEYLGHANTLDKGMRSKDFIPGRDRDKDGKLLGTGGNTWQSNLNAAKSPADKPDQATQDALIKNKVNAAVQDMMAKDKAARDLALKNKAEQTPDAIDAKKKAAQEQRDLAAEELRRHKKAEDEWNAAVQAQRAKAAADALKARQADDKAQQEWRAAYEKQQADLTNAQLAAAKVREANKKAEDEFRAAQEKRQRELAQAQADGAKAQEAEEMRRNKQAEEELRVAKEKQQQADAAKAQEAEEIRRNKQAEEEFRVVKEKEQQAKEAKAQADAAKAQEAEEMRLNKKAEEEFRAAQEKEQQAEQVKAQAAAAKAHGAEEASPQKEEQPEPSKDQPPNE